MKYEVTFEIFPRWPFGLPEGDNIVVPTGREVTSPTVEARTGRTIGYGTLSRYREIEEAVWKKVTLTDGEIVVHDNYIMVEVNASSVEEAEERAKLLTRSFLGHLSLNHVRRFAATILRTLDDAGGLYEPGSAVVKIADIRFYNLRRLRLDIESAASSLVLSCERLGKALQYFRLALFLDETMYFSRLEDSSQEAIQFVGPCFLNYWKAITAILGDPKTEAKRYQTYYAELGIDAGFYKNEVQPLACIRNRYDVAHYDLEESSTSVVKEHLPKAKLVSKKVIEAHRTCLLNTDKVPG